MPAPRIPVPGHPIRARSPVPLINRAASTEPEYPRVRLGPRESHYYDRNAPPRPSDITWLNRSVQDLHRIPTTADENQSYPPDRLFLSTVLPTRSPRALRTFIDECWRLFYASFSANQAPLIIQHPLDEINAITTSPLHFQNLLWRSQIILTEDGITEEYSWIRRQTRPDYPDRPYLDPVFRVYYAWTNNGWVVDYIARLTPA